MRRRSWRPSDSIPHRPNCSTSRGRRTSFPYIHPAYTVQLADATLPAQTFIGPSTRPVELDEALTEAIQQSWNFPEARERVAKCRHSVLLTDLMSSPLDHRDRLRLIQKTLAGLLTVVPPLAIHWRPTRQIIDPSRFLLAFKQGDAPASFKVA
jgi:hypothetical protein